MYDLSIIQDRTLISLYLMILKCERTSSSPPWLGGILYYISSTLNMSG
uniref:Uncharacterized protein n=1 Tax=viral metagenome TaxID=1070528 RepID=A0A6C0BLW8_9ZZZZ